MWFPCSAPSAAVTRTFRSDPSPQPPPARGGGVVEAELPLPLREGAGGRGSNGPHLWLMAAYGFVAGLPLPLSGFTFRLWLSEGGVSLAVIGLTANIGLAYSLKFLWAPVLDNALAARAAAPSRSPARLARRDPARAGRRRGIAGAVRSRASCRLRRSPLLPSSHSSPPARTSWWTPGASRFSPRTARALRWRPTSGAIASRC